MQYVAFSVYFLVPAVVYITFGIASSGLSLPDFESLKWFVPNYLFLAAPQLLWLVGSLAFSVSPAVSHVGYIAATIMLLAFDVFLLCCTNSHVGLWVVYYWALAAVSMLCTSAIVSAIKRWSSKQE
jgi:hypothetical protein